MISSIDVNIPLNFHLNSLLMWASIVLKDCMDEHKDWRKCQEHVKAFKACIDEQNKQKKT